MISVLKLSILPKSIILCIEKEDFVLFHTKMIGCTVIQQKNSISSYVYMSHQGGEQCPEIRVCL